MKERIYICHTYYHVYISFLKECNLRKESKASRDKIGQATLVLSKMSNNFENLKQRVEKTGLFEEVIEFDEKREDYFPELATYRQDRGNLIANLLQRMKFTKRYAQLEAPFVPVDLKKYKDIYVFCDSDPIGYYLNQYRIPYHGVEDGLNCLVHFDAARFDNRGHFGLKVFLSEKLNLIFVQNGYGKYCQDMEVNDIAAIEAPCHKYREVPRANLVNNLSEEDKTLILQAFVRNMEQLEQQIEECKDIPNKVLVLTDPLCDLETRKRIFQDIVAEYSKDAQIFIKPHPRDALDYREVFPELPIFDATVPMEMLNFMPNLHFKQVVTVFTELRGIQFADEVIRLGDAFMDKYEDPTVHNQNAQAGLKVSEPEKIILKK